MGTDPRDKYKKVKYEQILPYVLPYVNGCPPEIAEHNIRLAAIEFLSYTKLITSTMYLDAQEGVSDYFLEGDYDSECYCVSSIKSVCINSRDLERIDRDTCCPTDCGFTFCMPCDLYIQPAPCSDAARCIEVQVYLQPTQDGCSIDSWVYEKYAEALANGALSRLYNLTRQPWYDPSQAGLHAAFFDRVKKRARCLATNKHTTGKTFIKTKRWC